MKRLASVLLVVMGLTLALQVNTASAGVLRRGRATDGAVATQKRVPRRAARRANKMQTVTLVPQATPVATVAN